jgi:hypothetical protein
VNDFKAIAEIVKALDKDVTMELIKSRFIKACIGLSVLAWSIDFKVPVIVALFKHVG